MILKLVKDIYCRKMWDGVERVQLWRFCKIEYGHNGPFWHSWAYFYASAFRRWRHYVFGLSVRPSVRSLKYPLLTCTWVCWSTRPTVIVLRHVRPSVCPSVRLSVRPERFPGICQRTHGGNGLKVYMLMYLDHLQNSLAYGHGLLIFLILALFWLSETGQIWGFRAFPGERMEGMAWNMVCYCILTISELVRLW